MGVRAKAGGLLPTWTLMLVLCLPICVPIRAQPVQEPSPGTLLVAEEDMTDPRFEQSVLLLIKHDHTGSWGVVINKPTDVDVSEALPDMPGGVSRVYYGGPLKLDELMFIHRNGPDTEGYDTGVTGLRWSDSVQVLAQQLDASPENVRVYAGHAGWAPGQLEFELARGSWRMIQARHEDVFEDDPGGLWEHLTSVLGGIAI